uniref:Uncharacterized protein n=1 Tax=Steinernema glaseri TaxID=37863 RepID=A0A1I7ZFV6_9BILA
MATTTGGVRNRTAMSVSERIYPITDKSQENPGFQQQEKERGQKSSVCDMARRSGEHRMKIAFVKAETAETRPNMDKLGMQEHENKEV